MPAVVVETVCPIPNPTGLVMESSAASSADKKRNKLGYHRTSVACVHCRRRKIRCLVAADDSQGRCENCIRLRKECHFLAVDQQPPVEKRSRPGSKLETPSTDPSTASSSPPALAGGGAIDAGETMYPYHPMPMGSAPEMSAFNPAVYTGAPMSTFSPDPSVHPEFVTTQSLEPSVSWDGSGMYDAQMMAGKPRMGNPSPVMWTQQSGPVTPVPSASPVPGVSGVPGVPGMAGQQQMMNPGTHYAIQPDGSLWPMAPSRAMSLSAPTDMTSQYPSQYVQQLQQPEMKRRVTSPGQNMGQLMTPSPIQSPPPPMPNLHGSQMPMNFAGQPPPAMGFQSWTTMSPGPAGPGMEPGGYPIYPSEHIPGNFPGQPMAHPGQKPSPGQ